jgi:hypothetical protein
MIAGMMPQQIMDQSPNWTEIVSCVAAVAVVISPLVIWWFKRHGKTKK